jgi:hypothetical protein
MKKAFATGIIEAGRETGQSVLFRAALGTRLLDMNNCCE